MISKDNRPGNAAELRKHSEEIAQEIPTQSPETLKAVLLRKARRRSLRSTMIGVAVLLVFFCIGSIGLLSYLAGQSAVNDLTNRLRVEIADRVVKDLVHLLEGTSNIVRYNVSLKPDMRDLSTLHHRFFKQIMAFDEINTIFSGNEALESAGVERLSEGKTVLTTASAETGFAFQTHLADPDGRFLELISATPGYDPRDRPWYRRAVSVGSQTWIDPYPFKPRNALYIASACPVFGQDDRLEGVIAAALNLNLIGSFLDRLNVGQHGEVFIIDREGIMVAASGEKAVIHEKNGRLERLKAVESDCPLIGASAREVLERVGGLAGITEPVQFSFDLEGKNRLLHILPFTDKQGIDWLVIVTLTKADFMDRIASTTRQAVTLGFLVLAVALALGVRGAGWITSPILELSQAVHRLGAGDFSQRTTPARADEIGDLSIGFNYMADQLQMSFARIKQDKEELEKRVAERTSDLEAQNMRLEVEITERRRAEDALRNSEERLRILFNGINEAVFVHEGPENGIPGPFIELNDPAYTRLGYSRSELLTMHPIDIDAPETVANVPQMMERLYKEGNALWEGIHVCKDGSRIPVEIANRLAHLEGRQIIISTVRDITKRKKAEQSLRDAERFARETQRIGRIGGWKANPHTDYLEWTEGVHEIIEESLDYHPSLSEGMKYFLPQNIPLIRDNCVQNLINIKTAPHRKRFRY